MKPNHPIFRPPLSLAIIVVLMAGLSACQSTGMMHLTRTIAPEKHITLQPAGPHQGEADTGELVVAYTYQLAPDPDKALHVKGGIRRVKFRGDAATVYLNFIDNAGNVLDRKVLYASGNRRNVYFRRPSTFDTTLPLPSGTISIAFSSYVKASAGRR
jgi:hypothetical protein